MKKRKWKYRFGYTRIIAVSYLAVIFIGTLLLMLPFSSRTGEWTSFFDSLFTSVSASCVTGLLVVDTYTHWSIFGQCVLLVLIQLGGLGFMTVMCFVSVLMKKHMSLHQRKLVMQAAGHVQLGGVITLVRKILIGTFLFEGLGMILLSIRFCPKMGLGEGLFDALFHSVSAFCNAGFDLMGKYEPYSSLTYFRSDPYVQGVLMVLITIGGIGFFVWSDILQCGIHIKRYALHTKMVLTMSFILLVAGWIGFFVVEYDGALAGLSIGEKLLAALFQSVTVRTAGMTTIDQSAMTGGLFLTIVFMLIGGSPGSTAGGMKTTTIFVTLLSAVATVGGKKSATIFKKRISDDTLKQANAIICIYVLLLMFGTIALTTLENAEFSAIFTEVASAISTTGISLGLTPTLSTASKIILLLLTYAGRVGGFSFILTFSMEKANPAMERPIEKVLVG